MGNQCSSCTSDNQKQPGFEETQGNNVQQDQETHYNAKFQTQKSYDQFKEEFQNERPLENNKNNNNQFTISNFDVQQQKRFDIQDKIVMVSQVNQDSIKDNNNAKLEYNYNGDSTLRIQSGNNNNVQNALLLNNNDIYNNKSKIQESQQDTLINNDVPNDFDPKQQIEYPEATQAIIIKTLPDSLKLIHKQFPKNLKFYCKERTGFPIFEMIETKEIYSGQWKNGLRQGFGVNYYPDGTYYEGEWQTDIINGKGQLFNPKQNYYEGEFQDGLKQGKGTQTDLQGIFYEGSFQEGKMQGLGEYTNQGKYCYKGEMSNDLIEGYGVCQWTNGKQYDGMWQENKMNGYGAFDWPDGKKYVGEMQDDKFHGAGTFTWGNGMTYEGLWKNGLMDGQGYMTNDKGEKYSGQWDQGQTVSITKQEENI